MPSRTAHEIGPFTSLMRILFRKVIMNVCFVFGMIGNIITLVVLSRKYMRRSNTSAFLTALTIFDSFYLIGVFILNLQINCPKVLETDYYQYLLLIAIPLSDFSSNTSTCLTLMFTVQRYIAVAYPLHSRYIFRLSRARKSIVIVILFCFSLTFPTLLENKIEYYYDTSENRTKARLTNSKIYKNVKLYQEVYFWLIAVLIYFIPILTLIVLNCILIKYVSFFRKRHSNIGNRVISFRNLAQKKADNSNGSTLNETNLENNNNNNINNNNNNHIKMNKLTVPINYAYNNDASNFRYSNGNLENMEQHMNLLTKTTTATVNRVELLTPSESYLNLTEIRVHNSISINKKSDQSIILLIVVVLVFLISQLPSALLLIREAVYPLDNITDANKQDIVIGMNNIANGLTYINASINFVLYCCFSQKFRDTFKGLIQSFKCRKK